MNTLMQKFEGDSVHAVFNGRFEISTYFSQWERNTKGGRWELLYAKPINLVLSANMPTHYDSYKDSLSESTDIDKLSSELYFHIVFSLLRKVDENLLERLKSFTSDIDKKAKTIGILKAFYFFKASQKHLFSRKDFWHCMEQGNFYDDVFSMHYLYHFIIHAGQKDKLLDCGMNFKKFFNEVEIENTLKKLEYVNSMVEQLLELDYFRPTAIEFYKQYAAASEMTPEILEGTLSNALGRIYNFAEEK